MNKQYICKYLLYIQCNISLRSVILKTIKSTIKLREIHEKKHTKKNHFEMNRRNYEKKNEANELENTILSSFKF